MPIAPRRDYRTGVQTLLSRVPDKPPVFPDDHWTIEALVADQDLVACQWRFEANQPPPGSRIDVRAADFFKVRDGRLAQLRRFLDFESFYKQVHTTAASG
jgi:predicted ester cyclase